MNGLLSFYGRCGIAAALIGLCLTATSALAGYKLRSGDVLEVAIGGIPNLRQRALIDVTGEITLPLVGQVKVTGLSLPAAQVKIAGDLAQKVYRIWTAEGHEVSYLIVPDEVVVTIAEYRPIYINGDVEKPGEYPFRPGMTVRQAVAVAGGYGLARFGMNNPRLGVLDARAEYEALSAEFAREQARLWRLKSQLTGSGVNPSVRKPETLDNTSGAFVTAEAEQYKLAAENRASDVVFLNSAIAKSSAQLQALIEKKKGDDEGNRADVTDFERIRQLYGRGLASAMRLSEARRAALLSSDQLLQTVAQISSLERERGLYARELDKANGQNRIDDLKAMQDSELRIAQIKGHLKSAAEKLSYMGVLKSQSEGGAAQPAIAIHRSGETGPEHLANASEDLELSPGDVVDVSVRGAGGLVASKGQAPAGARTVPDHLVAEVAGALQ